MNIPAFFRFLNMKIEKYDRVATNPFVEAKSFIIIWIEEAAVESEKDE